MNAKDILDLANYVESSGIQISEELDVSIVHEVRKNTKKKIIKTVVVKNESSVDRLKAYEPYVDYILLDTISSGYVGGTGKTSDWNLCRQLVLEASKPVYLAGGLTPENVVLGMQTVKPAGVDISTGVSTYSESYLRKDRKCPSKINAFIQTVKEGCV
jgi:phosphoribosylanthranilate isomerase